MGTRRSGGASPGVGVLALAGVVSAAWCGSPDLPLDRPFTLRNAEPFLVEREYHRMIDEGGPRSYILPRPCIRAFDSSRVCAEPRGWRFGDSAARQALSVSPLGGYEHRRLGEDANAFELGLIASGSTGPAAFSLDARMYSELHGRSDHPSYDREGLDRQDGDQSGTVAYSSYSRYRAGVSYDWSWGRLAAGRDAAHWGPGLLSNLVFNQASVPFNQLAFTTRLGPVTLHSLYGQLAIGSDWETSVSTDTRSVFAHRYEWQPWTSLLFGMSEQLILHNASAPFAFIPVVPLFIAKSSEKERLNNGNIAVDASLRFTGLGSLYSEFLIDDIQSPGTLFGDHWGNKWGLLVGAHAVLPIRGAGSGVVVEYARLEPWVYTHYQPHTAQAIHFDHPLGNPEGPNSQSLRAKLYARGMASWYLGLLLEGVWKGTDTGSALLDSPPAAGSLTKAFLSEDPEADWSATPYVSWRWRGAVLYFESRIGGTFRIITGGSFAY